MSDSKLQYKKMSLEELVVLSQQNDLKALEELIKREQKNVFAAFSYLTDKRENISDLTQEALMRVAKNIANLKNPKNFKSWLNTIITNLFYDELRKSARKPDTISIDEDDCENSTFNLLSLIPDKKCRYRNLIGNCFKLQSGDSLIQTLPYFSYHLLQHFIYHSRINSNPK